MLGNMHVNMQGNMHVNMLGNMHVMVFYDMISLRNIFHRKMDILS